MPTYNFNDITKYKMRPIVSLMMYFPVGTFIEFSNLEQDSNYSIVPITRTTDRGAVRMIAHQLLVTAYPMQDNYEDIIESLLSKNNTLHDGYVMLGSHDPYLGAHPIPIINANGGAAMHLGYGATFQWSIESADKRRRLKIEVRKLYRTTSANLDSESDPNKLYTLLNNES